MAQFENLSRFLAEPRAGGYRVGTLESSEDSQAPQLSLGASIESQQKRGRGLAPMIRFGIIGTRMDSHTP